ncbi:MAG: redoxin domain-containing protein [Clostridia bacterium]|nr:redoxin domain-containing protein [Clostridia bacterium]
MKKNSIIWIAAGVAAFIMLIVGAYFLYDSLADGYAPDALITDKAQDDQSTQSNSQSTDEHSYQAAPDFTVVDVSGNPIKLSDMKGKPVVINFWASWCPPCKQEMPDFEEMYKNYGEEVTFMMVNLTGVNGETVASAKEHVAECGYTFPVYFDTQYEAYSAYQATSIPATYFVNADGELVAHAIGMISASILEQGIGMITE